VEGPPVQVLGEALNVRGDLPCRLPRRSTREGGFRAGQALVAVGAGVELHEPLGGVLRRDPERGAEDLGGRSRGGEADDGAGAVGGLPRRPESGQRMGLAGAGGADEDVQETPGPCDLADSSGLVVEQTA